MSVMSFDTAKTIQAISPAKPAGAPGDSAADKDLFATVFKQMKAEACTDGQPVDNPTGGCQGDGTNGGDRQGPDGRNRKTRSVSEGDVSERNLADKNDRDDTNTCNNCAIPPANSTTTTAISGSSHGSGAVMGALSEDLKKLVRVLRNSAVSKRRNVFMTLDLKDAGEVILDVRIEGKKVFIEASTSSRQAGAALTVSVELLKRALGECDLELADISIRTTRAVVPPKQRGSEDNGWSARAVAR